MTKYKNNEDDMHHLGIVSEDGSHKTATVYDAIQIKPKSVIRKSFLSFSNDQFGFNNKRINNFFPFVDTLVINHPRSFPS